MKKLINKIITISRILNRRLLYLHNTSWIGEYKQFIIKYITHKPELFKDWANNLYWLTKEDTIALNFKRNAVSDAINVTKLIQKLVQKNWTCIDIGACIGATSIPLWKQVSPIGRVYSIEADPKNIMRIISNLTLNKFPSNFVFNYAVCNVNNPVKINIIPNNNGWQSLGNPRSDSRLQRIASTITEKIVPGTTLDNFCLKKNITKINFLKIDVEGAELDVFQGSKRLLQNRKIDYIAFEISPAMLKWFTNRNEQDVLAKISNYSYQLFRILYDGSLRHLKNKYWPTGEFGDCLAISPLVNLPSSVTIRT